MNASGYKERKRLLEQGHREFSFWDIGLMNLTSKIGVEVKNMVRRSTDGFMKKLFENTRDILPIVLNELANSIVSRNFSTTFAQMILARPFRGSFLVCVRVEDGSVLRVYAS